MFQALDSIWIINQESGICYLHRVFNQEKDFGDETMFSGFISAILNFVTTTTQESIEGIVLGGFDIHIKSFQNVVVVLSTKKNEVIKELEMLMDKVGLEFTSSFKEIIDQNLVSVQEFEAFGENIDRIFGLKTIQIIPEHEMLIDLIKKTESDALDEATSAQLIVTFFKSLPDYKRKIIIENINKILMSVMADSSKALLLTSITTDVSKEFASFKQLILESQQKNTSEDDLIKEIVSFFDSIDADKKPALINKTKMTLELLNPSKKLDKDVRRKFENLLKIL